MSKLLVVIMLCLPGMLLAESAERMLSACKDIAEAKMTDDQHIVLKQDMDTGLCWGAFSILQTVLRIVSAPPNRRVIFGVCAPEGSTRSQYVKIFVEYATKNPRRLHEDFFFVARDALRETFPCQE